MTNYLLSERLKQKGKFRVKLLWIVPIITVLLALVLMNSPNLRNGAYNWWSTMMLPACITIFVCFSVSNEKMNNRHGLTMVSINKKKLWYAQILLYSYYLFMCITVFFVFLTITGYVIGVDVHLKRDILTSFSLFISFVWQIPLWMWVTEKTGANLTFIISMFLNIGIPIVFSTTKYWWLPFAIPLRIMCPIIGVQPNGLPVEAGSYLTDASVVPIGLVISVVLFLVLAVFSGLWYENSEV